MDFSVRVPGSCGELVQGWMDGEPFLVTCPIEMYTTVHVSDRIEGLHGLGRKSLRALELTLEFLGKESFPWGMELTSELPHGKGMASSSADIAAVAAATGLAFGRALTPQEILAIAVRIEPTDGVFFPSVVRMNQVTGTILEAYPRMPRFWIAVFDTGGVVDTVALHEKMRRGHEQTRWRMAGEGITTDGRFGPLFAPVPEDEQSLPQLRKHSWETMLPNLQGNANAIALTAFSSACWNNEILPKLHFSAFLEAVGRVKALGVCAAHSGTVLGALFPPELPEPAVERAVACIRADVPALAFLCRTRLRPGGIDVS